MTQADQQVYIGYLLISKPLIACLKMNIFVCETYFLIIVEKLSKDLQNTLN
jgi:hypothetical protein